MKRTDVVWRGLGLACLLSCLWGGSALAGTEPVLGFVETGSTLLALEAIAKSRIAIADVDGDGVADFVFSGSAGDSALLVVGRRGDGSIGIKQALLLKDNGGIARVLTANVAG